MTLVVPGQKYGVFGELLPCCRSVDTMWHLMTNEQVEVKLHADITDEDIAQRGPDGKPLPRVTPWVPYTTLKEWDKQIESIERQ